MNNTLTRILSTAILISIILSTITDTSAKEIKYNYCDKVFSQSWFEQVSPELETLCRNRFIYLTNQIKRTLPKFTF